MRTLLLLGALLCLCLTCSSPEPEGPPPNIVLIISDDHGWGDYGFMGHQVVKTPNIDRLVSESMLYTRGYVPSGVCRPSLATMITGLYPHQHGITGNDPPGGMPVMFDLARRAEMVEIFKRNQTLAEMLGEQGYVSHQSGKWWEGRPQDHGFSAAMTQGDVEPQSRHGDVGLTIGREGMQPIYDFVDAAGDKPFFLWYAPFLPHTPHNPPARLFTKYRASDRAPEVAAYYAMIEWLDETVGQLLGYLDEKGLRENTLVLYLGDNGWVQAVAPQAMPDTRSKMSPYEAGIRTPLAIRWPGRVEPGRDERTLVSSLDLAPTILRAAGLAPTPEMPGLDLRDRSRLEERKTFHGELFSHTAVDANDPLANLKYRYVIREDGWKLILPHTPNRAVPLMINGHVADWMRFEPELYNLLEDPHERQDRASEQPALVEALRSDLEAWWSVPQ